MWVPFIGICHRPEIISERKIISSHPLLAQLLSLDEGKMFAAIDSTVYVSWSRLKSHPGGGRLKIISCLRLFLVIGMCPHIRHAKSLGAFRGLPPTESRWNKFQNVLEYSGQNKRNYRSSRHFCHLLLVVELVPPSSDFSHSGYSTKTDKSPYLFLYFHYIIRIYIFMFHFHS